MQRNSIIKWCALVCLLSPSVGFLSACAFESRPDPHATGVDMPRPYTSSDVYGVMAAESLAYGGSYFQAARAYEALFDKFRSPATARRAFQLYVQGEDFARASEMALAWFDCKESKSEAFFIANSLAKLSQVTQDYRQLVKVLVGMEPEFSKSESYPVFVRSVAGFFEPIQAVKLLKGVVGSQKGSGQLAVQHILLDKAMQAGEWTEARLVMTHLGVSDPSPALRFSRAEFNAHEGQVQSAIEDLSQLMLLPAWEDRARLRLSKVYQQQREWIKALDLLKAIQPKAPLYWEAQKLSVSLLIKANRPAEALNRLVELEQAMPDQASVILLAKAELQAALGHYQASSATYEEVIHRFGANATLYYEIGMNYAAQGRMADFEHKMQEALGLDEDFVEALNALGYHWVDGSTDIEAGAKLLEKAKNLSQGYYVLDSWGWALFRLGRYAESLDYLNRAYGMNPDPEIAYHLASVYWALGQREETRKYVRIIQQSHPDFKHDGFDGLVKKLK